MRPSRTLFAAALVAGLAASPAFGADLAQEARKQAPDGHGQCGRRHRSEPLAPARIFGHARRRTRRFPATACSSARSSRAHPPKPAALKDGDTITSIDDKPCRDETDLDAVLDKATPGTKLKFTVKRGL